MQGVGSSVAVVLEKHVVGFYSRFNAHPGEGFNLLSDAVLDSSTIVLMSCETTISLICMMATHFCILRLITTVSRR